MTRLAKIQNAKKKLNQYLYPCQLCPRKCGINRQEGQKGFCQLDSNLYIASIELHFGEEPVISGRKGICNVFFAHCTLACCFCQNYQISDNASDPSFWKINPNVVVEKIITCLEASENNLGFVSPTHQLSGMLNILELLALQEKYPTVIYNSSGYERPEVLSLLDGIVDVYLPDLKYLDPQLSQAWSQTPDYPVQAQAALKEMFRQKGSKLKLDQAGIARDGLIIRHLVMPQATSNSFACLKFIAEELSSQLTISLMSQYSPIPKTKDSSSLKRTLTNNEYESVVKEVNRLGLTNGWVQEISSNNCFLPDFKSQKIFRD